MKVLAGIKVVDLSRYISGPYCAQMLGDMGAEVIKVESPKGEVVRHFEPSIDGDSLYYMVMNRNKKGITLELRTKKAKEILKKLFQSADIVIENFKPGTMKKIGFDWETLHKLNPRLTLVSISGFGQTGPMSEYPGFDSVIQAMGGLMSLTGSPDGPPYLAGTFIIDYATALYAANGALLALINREKTGRGQHVDVSLLNTAASILVEAIPMSLLLNETRIRIGNKDRNVAPAGCFKAKDDYVLIIAAPQNHWEKLTEIINKPELKDDPRLQTVADRYKHADELNSYVSDWVANHTRDEVINIMTRNGIPVAPVLTVSEFVKLPQVAHNKQIINVPYEGVGDIPMQGFPINLSETPGQIMYGPPRLGQHNYEILTSLGYTSEEIEEMKENGVI